MPHTLKFTKPWIGGSKFNDEAFIIPSRGKLFAIDSDFVFIYVRDNETIVLSNWAISFFSFSDSNCAATCAKQNILFRHFFPS